MKKRASKGWSKKEQAAFLSKLAQLIQAGYPLIEALTMMNIHLSKKQQQRLTPGIQWLLEGEPFYVVLERLHFQREAIAILCFSEKHGSLARALEQSSRFLEKKAMQIDTFKRMLRYPIFLMFTVFVVLILVQQMIIPQFSLLYSSMDTRMSWLIQGIFGLFQFLHAFLIIIGCMCLCLFGYGYVFFRKKSTLEKLRVISRVPLLFKGMQLMHTYLFSLQLSGLLQAGLSIYESLQAFKQQSYLPFLQEISEQMMRELRKGESMEHQISGSPFFERHFAAVIKHGEASGMLAREMDTYSQFLIENAELKIEKWVSWLQPVIYGLTAFLILIVYLSILLPMYQLMEQV
ncbi:competence protein ComGB [Bacillus xiamenensis]|uniref:Type II secretion system F family protein n=1 Tax=Bacillus xiamenensis TaxID=1178537 RepID=A0ABT4F6L9_9BACI|nr:competence type IV pilus assembly protein ComGB [Bacillus xiamenensis]MBG9910124.1 competence protein ComGB [Bacillus xiamenensis]MCY9577697.1 type II secretion system F family protein [Bacillus xiamenensis]